MFARSGKWIAPTTQKAISTESSSAHVYVEERDRDERIPKPLSTGVENAQKGFIYQIWQPLPNLDLFLTGTPMNGKNADTKAL